MIVWCLKSQLGWELRQNLKLEARPLIALDKTSEVTNVPAGEGDWYCWTEVMRLCLHYWLLSIPVCIQMCICLSSVVSDKNYRLLPTQLVFRLSGYERTTTHVDAAIDTERVFKRFPKRTRWSQTGGREEMEGRRSEWETKTLRLEGYWVCNSRGSARAFCVLHVRPQQHLCCKWMIRFDGHYFKV